MNKTQKEKMREMAAEMGSGIKSEEDLNAFSAELKKIFVESAMGAEMEHHLGYDRHSADGNNTGNSRNGNTPKILKGSHGEIEIETPRDRNGTFEPVTVRKRQRRLTAMDDQVLCLYAKGLTTREIVEVFDEMYGAEISAGLVSQITNTVMERVREWQERPLDEVYPIVYLDCIVLKIRQDKRVIKKSVYLALGIDLDGNKELLGMWIAETEGASFWLSVLTELRMRGVEQILIFCVDGLKGFPDAIEAEYPKAKVQLCIVHMIRNSLRFVSWKDKKALAGDLRKIYKSTTEEAALAQLDQFSETWDSKYPQVSKSWRDNWPNLITIFDYPKDIRKVIYTTNAIESLNSVIRKATKKRKIFPNDAAAMKVVFLATEAASKRWTRPIAYWKKAMSRFMIHFKEQLEPYV
jgi:transposase-like protein